MKEGTDIILFCRENNNVTNDVNFQSIDTVYNYEEIKKYIDDMTVSDLLDPNLREGFKLIMNHFDRDTIDDEESPIGVNEAFNVQEPSYDLSNALYRPLIDASQSEQLASPPTSSPPTSNEPTTVPLPLPEKKIYKIYQ